MNLFSRLLISQLVPQNLFEKAQPSQYPFFLFKHVYTNLLIHLLGLFWCYALLYAYIITSPSEYNNIFYPLISLLLFFVSIPLVWNLRLWFYLKKNPLSLGNVNAE